MNRRLILLRHAKSDWDAGAGTDHERPLNKRGRRDAPQVGQAIAALGWTPEVVLSSDAKRTRETWQRMRPSLEGAPEARLLRSLYLGDLDTIRAALAELSPAVTTVMVIGHNPGWEEAASALTGQDIHMTTCNAAMMTVEAEDWKQAGVLSSVWNLEHLLRPKEL